MQPDVDSNFELDEYNCYFSQIQPTINTQKILQAITEKGICVANAFRTKEVEVEAIKGEHRGALVRFRVSIGQFNIPVVVLNVPGAGRMTGKKVLYGN